MTGKLAFSLRLLYIVVSRYQRQTTTLTIDEMGQVLQLSCSKCPNVVHLIQPNLITIDFALIF